MERNNTLQIIYEEQVNKFLDEFMDVMYKGNDHIVARKYFRDLFNMLIPKYFCICESEKREIEQKIN
jgi:hypothetical protein